MRTFGANRLGLPDLAAHASGHREGERYFNMFENILRYVQESSARLASGHTMQIDNHEFLRFREATQEESFLESDGELFVAEPIRPDQINRRRATKP